MGPTEWGRVAERSHLHSVPRRVGEPVGEWVVNAGLGGPTDEELERCGIEVTVLVENLQCELRREDQLVALEQSLRDILEHLEARRLHILGHVFAHVFAHVCRHVYRHA